MRLFHGFPALAGLMLATTACWACDSRTQAQQREADAAPGAGNVGACASTPQVFDPERAVKPSPGSVEAVVLAGLRGGHKDKALQLAEAAVKYVVDPAAGRLHWLAAKAAQDQNRAREHLKLLAESGHPLSKWAQLEMARSLRSTQPEASAQQLQSLVSGWAGASAARRLRALALLEAGRHEEAVPLLRKLVEQAGANSAAASAAMPLADLLAARRDRAAREEALELYRRVASRAPLAEVGREARLKAKSVLGKLPPKRRRALASPSPDHEFARGRALMNARTYAEAEAVYARLAKRSKKQPDQLCQARLQQGRAMLRQRNREQGAALLVSTANQCPDPDARAWARYYAGRAYLRVGNPTAGIAQFDALRAEAPEHRLADDALYKSAFAAEDAGDEKRMVARLAALLKRFPNGDMRPEARFQLALLARRQGRLKAALKHLEALIAEGPAENTEGMEGRAQYWRARTLNDLGRASDARNAYAELLQAGPLYYYAQQSLERLLELDPDHAKQLLVQMRDADDERPLTFCRRPEMERPAFRRAIELLRVGETALAKQEMAWMGATGLGADQDLLWLAAALFHYAEAYPEANTLARRRLRSFMVSLPKGEARAKWRIGFPSAYAPLIEEVAKQAQIPAAYVRAVAREESSFNPRAVSRAHAYGLIQLIRRTAKHHARELGLPYDPASLKRPEINLRIGANFIRYLWRRYPSNHAVVPAAYNAGHGAAQRWLRERPGCQLDTWVETIPFAETRRYTRRVLQTYGIYSWLDTGKLPGLPAELPPPR